VHSSRPGSVGRTVDVFDFTAAFLAATREAGVEYVVAEHGGRTAFNEGYAIPAIPFLSRVEDPATFQPLFGRDTATCGFSISDALLVRADLAERVVAAGTSDFRDRYVVAPTVLAIDRGYAWADVAFDLGTVRFVTTHLESLWDPDEPTIGAAQARQLVADLADTTMPLVVIGDLNTDPRDPRPAGAPNPALQPEAGEGCAAQVAAPDVASARAECNAYWTLVQAGFEDAGPDAADPANLTWGSSALLAGPDPSRVDAALEQGNPYGFTDRLDYVLVRGGIVVLAAEVIGNVWPDGPDVWACDAPDQVANTAAMTARLAEAGDTEVVDGRGICLPTDHAGLVATVRLPPTAAAAVSPPPPEYVRGPFGVWSVVGLALVALVVWRVVRRIRRRRRTDDPLPA
jgi:endonuclease/exonuclease/phosphatase family metal-dependent hydrolase